MLWRAIDWHRSGDRGRKQKTAAIEQGIKDGYLSNSYPFILDQAWITRCRATVRWEVIGEEEDQWVEEEEEEEEEEEAEETRGDLRTPREPDHPPSWVEFPNFPKAPSSPPPEASPRIVIAKAKTSSGAVPTFAKPTVSRRLASESSQVTPRPSAKRSQPATEPVSEVASSSGSRIVSISKSSPVPPPPRGSVLRSLGKGSSTSSSAKVGQPLAPQYLLPENARYLTWDSRGILTDYSTRGFVGVLGVYIELPASEKFCLCLDWHQVIDRSKTSSAWATKSVPKENLELLKRLKARFGNNIVICVVSHIGEKEGKNERNLVECCNSTPGLSQLISFVVITRSRDGPFGKLRAIEALSQRKSPALIIDDNHLVIDECSAAIWTIHIKLRKKRSCRSPDVVRQFLEETEEDIAEAVHKSIPQVVENYGRVRVPGR